MLDEVMQKPFKSVTEQVSILKSRGLTIKDEKAAINKIQNNGLTYLRSRSASVESKENKTYSTES